jgi:hypothetical protein
MGWEALLHLNLNPTCMDRLCAHPAVLHHLLAHPAGIGTRWLLLLPAMLPALLSLPPLQQQLLPV